MRFAVQIAVSTDLLASAAETVDAWAPLASHPNLSCPRGAFASGELGGGVALYLVYPLWPCAISLEQAHLLPTSGPSGARDRTYMGYDRFHGRCFLALHKML